MPKKIDKKPMTPTAVLERVIDLLSKARKTHDGAPRMTAADVEPMIADLLAANGRLALELGVERRLSASQADALALARGSR